MSWNSQMDPQYVACPSPYNSAGSFVDFFAGLTYDHVNFIFSGSSQMQDDQYSPVNMGYYKYGYSELVPAQYYSNSPSYEVFDNLAGMNEFNRRDNNFPSTMTTEPTRVTNQQSERASNANTNTNPTTRNRDCPRNHHESEYQAIWHDNIDPDQMSYEELLELGETVGTHSRGLSHEQISSLPVSKFRCCFLRRKSRSERCVICQMEYKRGARLITLPCKHKYHVGCGTKWLSINKACPICYTEVSVDGPKKSK
ncbi:hypothetical protein vseg_008621 [Gypsophila vaccaria]